MTELETKIKKYADAYYEGNELISDADYDTLIEQLRQENPNSELLDTVVGDELKGVTKKYKLPITMGTLAKCRNESEFKEWYKSKGKKDYVIELKVDGCLDGDTLLETEDGLKTIKDIVENKSSKMVKAFNFENDKIEFTKIKNRFINDNDFEWYEIELEDGTKIKATENHKFFLPELNCFREVSKLNIGDELKIDN